LTTVVVVVPTKGALTIFSTFYKKNVRNQKDATDLCVCMYVCMYVCLFVHTYAYVSICVLTSIRLYACVCLATKFTGKAT